MQVNSGVSENLESFSNFQRGREISLHQISSHKRGSAEKPRDPDQQHLYSACCFLYRCEKKQKKKKDGKAVVVRSMNKTNLADFCLTGFPKPRAHLSKGLSRLTFLQPNHFPLVSFQSHLFLLPLLLSSLIPSPFLLLSQNHFYPTVSFHSSGLGLNCPPLLCHSTPVLTPS